MASVNGVFITGTDTDVGKTVISAAIIRSLVAGGLSVAGLKPIASGFKKGENGWKNDDVDALTNASNLVLPNSRVNRYAFKEAIAPHIAATQAGVSLDFNLIKQDLEYAANRADFVLVEGVGGWHVPLSDPNQNPSQDIQCLAQYLKLPVIMVVGLRLGCLNHAILTAKAIKASGLPLVGWVANHIDPNFPYVDENIAFLDQQLIAPRLFDVPYTVDLKEMDLTKITNSAFIKMHL